LSIKDIGIILERLSARIIDVDRLEREIEASDVRHWTIRAAVRGGEGALRELGVIDNSNYYSIGEHPGYRSGLDEEEEEDDDEDDIDERDEETNTAIAAPAPVAVTAAAAASGGGSGGRSRKGIDDGGGRSLRPQDQ